MSDFFREHTMSSTPRLRFSHAVERAPHPVGSHCDIRQFRHTDFDGAMSPLVLADHFIMTGPTFDLHPHAGMSAVTLLFESTRGRMSSHDSVHNNHLIEPGDLHWTLAGSGIVHTQRPHGENAWLDGLQLFVNLPARLKRTEPTTLLLRAADVPVIEYEGARLRVLAGDLAGVRSPLQPPEPILIVDGRLHAGAHATLPLPEGWNLWLYVRAGSMAAREVAATVDNGVALASGQAATVSAAANGNVELHGPDGEVAFVAIAGPAIHEPVIQLGPFVMNSRAEADQALADFQAGKFGTVPSFA